MLAKSETTIANILSAAGTLFITKNYADVTMDQIAEACRMTKGALYHHFPSKEELYMALMRADLAEKKALFREAVASGTDCRDRLRRLTRAFFELPRAKRELIKLVRRDINVFNDPSRTELVMTYQASLPELIERVLRDGIERGELASADPRLLSWHYVALVEVTLGRYADDLFHNSEAKLDFVLDLFFRGAGAREGAKE